MVCGKMLEAHRCRRQLRSQVVLVKGVVSRYDGTINIIVSDLKAIDARVRMPEAHDWGIEPTPRPGPVPWECAMVAPHCLQTLSSREDSPCHQAIP